jgi:hypothetical protein
MVVPVLEVQHPQTMKHHEQVSTGSFTQFLLDTFQKSSSHISEEISTKVMFNTEMYIVVLLFV